jgi:hypothetical protein
MQGIYEEYAILESQIAALELKKEQLRPFILERMTADGVEKLDTGMGKFSITKLKKWIYPEHVIELGEKFKEAKAKAESTQEATYTEQDSLRFTAVKL